MQDPVLELRQRLAGEPGHRRAQASLQRCERILPEVVVILQEDRVDEEPELDVEVRGRQIAYFGIHTRTSDSSLSTSSGFAM